MIRYKATSQYAGMPGIITVARKHKRSKIIYFHQQRSTALTTIIPSHFHYVLQLNIV